MSLGARLILKNGGGCRYGGPTSITRMFHWPNALPQPSERSETVDFNEWQMCSTMRSTSTISWEEAVRRGAPRRCEAAFRALMQNIVLTPILDQAEALHDLFLQGSPGLEENGVWQYQIPARLLSERWIQFMPRGEPTQTFRYTGHLLIPVARCAPERETILRRILVRRPKFSNSLLYMGPWSEASPWITQYEWRDGTEIVNSSTAQLRILQVMDLSRIHGALSRWERQLAYSIPGKIWTSIWLPYIQVGSGKHIPVAASLSNSGHEQMEISQ